MNTRRAASGFTLIELMVVLALITLMTGLIVPSAVSALRGKGVQSEGEKLIEMLRFAQMSAITRHHAVDVNIDRQRGLCWISLSKGSLPWLEDQVQSRTQTLSTLQLPKNLQVIVTRGRRSAYAMESSQQWERFTFRANGGSENLSIRLTDTEQETFTLEVIGATGEILVRKL